MKILCTADTHFPFDPKNWPEADIFVHAGDLMLDGTPQEWNERVDSLRKVNVRHKLYVPGNHDFHPQLYRGVARHELWRHARTMLCDGANPVLQHEGVNFLCIPGITKMPGWAYNEDETEQMDYLNTIVAQMPQIDVVVTHIPPYGIRDSVPNGKSGYHIGSQVLRQFFDLLPNKPSVWICGHVHESYGTELIEGCRFVNAAHCNDDYQQVNPPILVSV